MKYQDAVTAAPAIHQVVFENDEIRLLRVTVGPGAKAEMHSHPRNLNYVTQGGRLRFTSPEGQVREVELTEGQVLDSQAAAHEVENVGSSTVETLQTEFKT